MSEVILVLSNVNDPTAQRVIHALQKRGADVLFFDTGFFPLQSELDVTFVESRWQGVVRYKGRQYDLAHIKSVFVRRPTHYVVDHAAPEPIQAFLVLARTHPGISRFVEAFDSGRGYRRSITSGSKKKSRMFPAIVLLLRRNVIIFNSQVPCLRAIEYIF